MDVLFHRDNLLHLTEYIERETVLESPPPYLVIEPTNVCNLSCLMCPHRVMKRGKGFMDFGLFRKIIDEASEFVDLVYLHLFGEPLLHPRIVDFVNYAGGKGFTVVFSTNGLLLNERMIHLLMDSPLDLLILSLDAVNPSKYEMIRKGGDFHLLLRNLERFDQEFNKSRNRGLLNAVIQFIEMRINQEEVDAFVDFCRSRFSIPYRVKRFHCFADQIEEIRKLDIPLEQKKPLSQRVCYEPWRGMVVGWDGKVVPCCNDYDYKYVLGDLKEKTILEIWNGERIRRLREIQRNGNQDSIELCRKCNVPHVPSERVYGFFNPLMPSLNVANNFINCGLYPSEFKGQEVYCWTGKRFKVSLQDRRGKVIFRFHNINPLVEGVGMEISLYDKLVGGEWLQKNTYKQVVVETPAPLRGRMLTFDFSLSTTWIPDEVLKNGDRREVGLKLMDIQN